MLARAAGLAANEERADAFADAASIPTWARGSVGAAAEAGYMTGYPNGAFGALGSITRAGGRGHARLCAQEPRRKRSSNRPERR